MRIGIIQFPGSNCERETALAVKRCGMIPVDFLWNEPIEKLANLDGYIIVGGFSYEDRSRAGIIAALDPVMNVIREHSKTGKPVLGICNGAQILVEAGLVPGFANTRVALTNNKRVKDGIILGTGYYNAWTNLRLAKEHRHTAFTRYLNAQSVFHIPIAHGEGRFVIPPPVLNRMRAEGLLTFQYCTPQGDIIDEFPTNPNGSILNIAAISNAHGNIMAMMPHPERTTAGDAIFLSMKDYIAQGFTITKTLPSLPSIEYETKPFAPHPNAHQMVVDLIITDNCAFTVQNTLKHVGIPAIITRQTHWEITCDSPSTLHLIQASGALYNDRKEYLIQHKKTKAQYSFLVRAKEDLIGLQKKQQLNDQFGIHDVSTIRHGILWHVKAEPALLDTIAQEIVQSGILFNPISQECYDYV